jgi:hypothetical protein
MRAMLNEAMVNDWNLANPFKKVHPGELITVADERRGKPSSHPLRRRYCSQLAPPTSRHLRVLVRLGITGEFLRVGHGGTVTGLPS